MIDDRPASASATAYPRCGATGSMDDVRAASDWLERTPAPGSLLVALPLLTDPNFTRSVVYLLEADPDAGAVGVVLTSPTRTPVETVLPRWHDAMSEPDVVFRGGPMQTDGALCLARVPLSIAQTRPLDSIRTVRRARDTPMTADRVGVVDLDGDVDDVRAATVDLRVYAGHAGWAEGQLEDEIAEGAWAVLPARPEDVFTSAPERRWRDVFRRQPFPVNLIASYPADPTVN